MYYSDEIVEEVRSRNDIVDVIGSYVNLKHKGNSYSTCCPFHSEKTPSFHVSRDKQMYYCFGCHVGGNVYTFLMEHENFTFPEAVEYLADRAGITLPEKSMSAEQKKRADERTKIKDMNKSAAAYFHYLLRSEHGKKALEYLTGRGLTEETIDRFGLGYADVFSNDLYNYLKKKGYTDSDMKNSGLVRFDEKRGAMDQFWNRAMYPIVDANNKVIGFGGRVMGEGNPKYLNTPDTPVFDKSRNLYGLNLAKKSKRKGIIFCEGYMDVISMHQAGFDNAVASLGTALTVGQVSLIKRYTDRVYLAYDSDNAGTMAAIRALGIMREFEMPAKVISLKPYKDPDELIQAEGSDEFERRINEAQSGVMFEIGILEQKFNQEDPQERTEFQKETAKVLSRILDPLERNNYIDTVSKKYNIEREPLKKAVTEYGVKEASRIDESVFREPNRRGSPDDDKNSNHLKTERVLITWLINDNALIPGVRKYLSNDDFADETYNEIVRLIYSQYEEKKIVEPAVIMDKFQSIEEHNKVSSIIQQHHDEEITNDEKSRVITDLVKRVKSRSIQQKMDAASGNLELIGKLMIEKKNIAGIKIEM